MPLGSPHPGPVRRCLCQAGCPAAPPAAPALGCVRAAGAAPPGTASGSSLGTNSSVARGLGSAGLPPRGAASPAPRAHGRLDLDATPKRSLPSRLPSGPPPAASLRTRGPASDISAPASPLRPRCVPPASPLRPRCLLQAVPWGGLLLLRPPHPSLTVPLLLRPSALPDRLAHSLRSCKSHGLQAPTAQGLHRICHSALPLQNLLSWATTLPSLHPAPRPTRATSHKSWPHRFLSA